MIYFDIDDTLFNTRDALVRAIAKEGYLVEHQEYIGNHNCDSDILNRVHSNPASFLFDAEIFEGVYEFLAWLRANDVKLGVCSHRGMFAEGRDITVDQLARHDLLKFFDGDQLWFPHHEHKLEYLDGASRISGVVPKQYMLVDDAPIHRFLTEGNIPMLRSSLGSVVVFDRPWNQNVAGKRFSAYDLRDAHKLLEWYNWSNEAYTSESVAQQ